MGYGKSAMSLSLRFILPLFVALSLISWASISVVEKLTESWFIRDVEARARTTGNALELPVRFALETGNDKERRERLLEVFHKTTQDERLFGLALCREGDRAPFARTLDFPQMVDCEGQVLEGRATGVIPFRRAPIQVTYIKMVVDAKPVSLLLVHDLSFMTRRSEETKRYIFWFFAILAVVVSFITVVIAQLSWRGWVQGLRAVVRGEGLLRPFARSAGTVSPELRPLVKDLRAMMREIEAEKPIHDDANVQWSPAALKEILQQDLRGEEILIVSNREPYIHNKDKDGKITAKFPASGLVSALEPVMRACSGTWIAHGSGNADREVVDQHDRVKVPPDKPSYQIRRVWLSEEEEQGYYYGFSNEGLWPLCHVAHTRPVFRSSDWEMYVKVNRKFADAVVEEARTDNPVILVQDYHFALLPRMVKEKLPNASVITFWHIPWPNPEAFGINPWREEILHGMLGSSILGFHTRFHCNNFLETVDRFMETRIDREKSTITSAGNSTAVRQYPISIEWPSRWLDGQPSVGECHRVVRAKLGLAPDIKLGIGVDRLDYTKGILERFRAVDRLLELEPQWRGKFSFVQIASPSRSTIDHYKAFDAAVRDEAERINKLYGTEDYKPIHLLVEHHGPKDVFTYFRACDICFVSSLHDGMNLVAKEYVAAREDEQGVLILSQFTGAARELPEALIVNPYDTDQCAAALQMALEMSTREQRDRMRSMRNFIKEFNVYRWAGRMLIDAARMRQKSRFREKKFFGGMSQ